MDGGNYTFLIFTHRHALTFLRREGKSGRERKREKRWQTVLKFPKGITHYKRRIWKGKQGLNHSLRLVC